MTYAHFHNPPLRPCLTFQLERGRAGRIIPDEARNSSMPRSSVTVQQVVRSFVTNIGSENRSES